MLLRTAVKTAQLIAEARQEIPKALVEEGVV